MASPQLELVACATQSPQRAAELWRELLGRVRLDDFDYPAQRLLPAVWKNLRQAEVAIPEAARLQGVYRRVWVENAHLRRACHQVLDLFEAHGVPALVLKGLAFNQLLYADLGSRPSADFDLLVPYERADEAFALLSAHGWEPVDRWERPRDRLHHGMTWRSKGAELDLHWFLLREARWPEADDPFWRDSVAFDMDGRTAYTLSATHQLFHLIAIANREPHNLPRYLIDLHHLARRHGAGLDCRAVARLLEERNLLSRMAGLPLAEMGLQALQIVAAPSLLDRAWSEATRSVFDGSHEWHYLLFPFLDYWLNFRGRARPGWGFFSYMWRRLEIRDPWDLVVRTFRKLQRMARQRWR
jgi:hypothetical protein